MLDYWKLLINDKPTIDTVLKNDRIKKNFTSNEDGVLTGTKGSINTRKYRPFPLHV